MPRFARGVNTAKKERERERVRERSRTKEGIVPHSHGGVAFPQEFLKPIAIVASCKPIVISATHSSRV